MLKYLCSSKVLWKKNCVGIILIDYNKVQWLINKAIEYLWFNCLHFINLF